MPEDTLLQAAKWVGEHALPLYLSTLATLLVITAALWFVLSGYLIPRARHALPRPWLFALCIALGFTAVLAAGSSFAEITESLHAQAAMGRADQVLTDTLRTSLPASALSAFATVTHLADPVTQTGLCVVGTLGLVALGRRWLALAWLTAVAGNGVLNTALKQVFARVRPIHDDGLVRAEGFSFPSGHSSGSIVIFGMLAYLGLRLLPRRWHLPTLLTFIAMAFTVGVSRVFLRVHFASDVLAGFASGTAWLAVCIGSIELARWFNGRSPQVGTGP